LATPYNWIRDIDGSCLFLTDFNLRYRVYFIEINDYFRDFPEFSALVQTFGFEILENPASTVPHDPRVGVTISFIILQFFEQNPEGVLFFILDGFDGKEKGRKRKFEEWYRRVGTDKLLKKDAEMSVGRFTIYSSILLRANHPLLDKIILGYDQLVVSTMTKPEE
jgi:hypothetical protein